MTINYARILCFFGKHDLSTWRRTKVIPDVTEVIDADDLIPRAMNKRHCKRAGCEFAEYRPVKFTRAPKAKRPANEADTLQGKP